MIDFFEEFVPGLNVLAQFAYQQSVHFFPDAYGTFFDLTNRLPENPVVREMQQVGYPRARAYIDKVRPDAVISVFPVAGGVVSEIKAERPLLATTVITDFGAHWQWLHPATDIYFVACEEMRADLIERGVDPERVVVSGIPVREVFSERLDRADARRELGLEDAFTVLATATAGSTGDVRDVVAGLAEAGIQVLALTGRSDRLRRRLQSVERRTGLVRVFGLVDEVRSMMCAADVLLGKAGGLTVSEALALGLPLIAFNPVPGQEVFNVDFLVNYGAGLQARDVEDAVEKVRFLSSHPDRLRQLASNARALGRPDATRTVTEHVLSAMG